MGLARRGRRGSLHCNRPASFFSPTTGPRPRTRAPARPRSRASAPIPPALPHERAAAPHPNLAARGAMTRGDDAGRGGAGRGLPESGWATSQPTSATTLWGTRRVPAPCARPAPVPCLRTAPATLFLRSVQSPDHVGRFWLPLPPRRGSGCTTLRASTCTFSPSPATTALRGKPPPAPRAPLSARPAPRESGPRRAGALCAAGGGR